MKRFIIVDGDHDKIFPQCFETYNNALKEAIQKDGLYIKEVEVPEGNLTGRVVNLELIGLDGNAFSLMGAFQRQARREKWSKAEIDIVLTACTSGSYDKLVGTLISHCKELNS